MIDFRYHIVSLVAVFLAIALGIVIGTTALNGRVLDDLEDQVTGLQEDKRNLEDNTQALQARLDTGDLFEEAVGPALVAGTLAERSVLLVLDGEVDDDAVDAVGVLIGQAGGTLTGTIRLTDAYADPANETALQNYVTGSGRPTGVTLPATDDTGELVASVLAQVLVNPPGVVPAPDSAQLSSVLAGLSALDVLTQESPSVQPADHVIVLTEGAVEGDDAEARLDTLVELVTALDGAGSGAVVAGNAAAAGDDGLIGVLRNDPEVSGLVSTVDNVDTAAGRISSVLALSQEGEGTSGKYGTGEDTQPVPPVPAATP
ncbi:copper transporter [Trujillonella endophytica]|uniref:Copper transport outer membrane protein, MctB n=1 Tax=Trujillonella endophytica TaxID=673521 RepID=A0A1H8T800_9ACTN|nr:copper transporter [Trujillella endophytica]SEO87031.1 Copper transport outer membrane protein, MctB [Trujillella endophytica]